MNRGCTYFIYTVFSFLVLVLVGCGREHVPDPPLLKSKIVLDTFKALEDREHEIAIKKISRLRELDPSNVFLANLEVLERNNSVIKAAQAKIDENDLKGALAMISDGIMKYGRHNNLMKVQKKLKIITKIEDILKVFKSPRDSDHLLGAATQLKKIGDVYKPSAIFLPLAKEKIAEAGVMHNWEMKRAVIDLVSQMDDMQKAGDEDMPLLYAILENEDPENPVVRNYLEYLNGDEDVDLEIYPEENIFATEDSDEDSDDDGELAGDDDGAESEDIQASPEVREEDTNSKKEEKKGGWWNKFSF
jgi:hypothetical protein